MDKKTKEIYSEVYSALNMLGNDYIKKLPSSLFDMIKSERLDTYNPTYDGTIALDQQNIKRESISMIALFHLNYWCENAEEKEKLCRLFQENENKYQEELREKYNPDNLFKSKEVKEEKEESTELIEYKENSLFKKIINKLMSLFKNS